MRDSAEDVEEEEGAAATKGSEARPRAFEKTMTPGVILRVTGMGAAGSVDTLAVYLNSLGELKFAENDPVAKVAHARFEKTGEQLCMRCVVVGLWLLSRTRALSHLLLFSLSSLTPPCPPLPPFLQRMLPRLLQPLLQAAPMWWLPLALRLQWQLC